MKKRKWVFPVCIIGGVLLICLIGGIVFVAKNYVGTYVEGSGSKRHMVVYDHGGPMVLYNDADVEPFKDLETGDRVLIICGAMDTTYLPQSDAKLVIKLGEGSVEEIPKQYREELTEWGWLKQSGDSEGAEDASFPDWGLTLSAKDVSPTGLTLVYGQTKGNPTGQIQWGDAYQLSVFEEGTWKDVPIIVKNAVWNAIAYGFGGDKDVESTVSWEWLYGKLPTGTYRLEKEVMDFRGTGDYDTAVYWVEFEITE